MSAQTFLNLFESHNWTISQFLLVILGNATYQCHHLVEDLHLHAVQICQQLAVISNKKGAISKSVQCWAAQLVINHLQQELLGLAKHAHQWKFGATKVSAEQVEGFRIERLGLGMEHSAPVLWATILGLLEGTGGKRLEMWNAAPDADHEKAMDVDEKELWDAVGDLADLGDLVEDSSIRSTRVTSKQALSTLVCARSALLDISDHIPRKQL